MSSTYPSSLSLKRTLGWSMRGEPIGWLQHGPNGCFLFFEGVCGGVEFPSSSHCSHQLLIVPIKFLLFPLITHQHPFVLIKFSNSSYQILLVLMNNPSQSFCSHQVLIKFFLFPSTSHQFIFVPNPIYINPCKGLNFGIKSLFCSLKTWLLRWFHGEKDKKECD
jgi:hypothetical protein